MTMEFKKLPKDRNGECLDLVWYVFSLLETPIFGEEAAKSYKAIIEDTRKQGNITFYAALDCDRVVGALGMRENNHIGYFYINPEYQRQGIGKKLFELMKGDYEIRKFTVNAMPTGVAAYARLGFTEAGEKVNNGGVITTPLKYDESAPCLTK